jgi:hypothetical protein
MKYALKRGTQQQQRNKGKGRGNEQPIKRAHTKTFERSPESGQGLKRALNEGSRYSKCHFATLYKARFVVQGHKDLKNHRSRRLNCLTKSHPAYICLGRDYWLESMNRRCPPSFHSDCWYITQKLLSDKPPWSRGRTTSET